MDNISTKARLERFYSLEIPDTLPDVRREQLITDIETDDLFAAHLYINNAWSARWIKPCRALSL